MREINPKTTKSKQSTFLLPVQSSKQYSNYINYKVYIDSQNLYRVYIVTKSFRTLWNLGSVFNLPSFCDFFLGLCKRQQAKQFPLKLKGNFLSGLRMRGKALRRLEQLSHFALQPLNIQSFKPASWTNLVLNSREKFQFFFLIIMLKNVWNVEKNYFQTWSLSLSLCVCIMCMFGFIITHYNLGTKSRSKLVIVLKYLYFQCGELIRFLYFLALELQNEKKHYFLNNFIEILRQYIK